MCACTIHFFLRLRSCISGIYFHIPITIRAENNASVRVRGRRKEGGQRRVREAVDLKQCWSWRRKTEDRFNR